MDLEIADIDVNIPRTKGFYRLYNDRVLDAFGNEIYPNLDGIYHLPGSVYEDHPNLTFLNIYGFCTWPPNGLYDRSIKDVNYIRNPDSNFISIESVRPQFNIAWEHDPEFRHIPGFSNYVINDDGTMCINITNGKNVKMSYLGKGYPSTNLTTDAVAYYSTWMVGAAKTLMETLNLTDIREAYKLLRVPLYQTTPYDTVFIHHLVVMAWKDNWPFDIFPNKRIGRVHNPEVMTIDHRDGNKENNYIGNLDIVTLGENLKRYQTGFNKAVAESKFSGGSGLFYPEMTFAEYLELIGYEEISHETIKVKEKSPQLEVLIPPVLKQKEKVLAKISDKSKIEKKIGHFLDELCVIDLDDPEKKVQKLLRSELAEVSGAGRSAISEHLKKKSIESTLSNRWLAWEDDSLTPNLEIAVANRYSSSSGIPVVGYNVVTKEVKEFVSLADAKRHLESLGHENKRVLDRDLKGNKQGVHLNWSYRYKFNDLKHD